MKKISVIIIAVTLLVAIIAIFLIKPENETVEFPTRSPVSKIIDADLFHQNAEIMLENHFKDTDKSVLTVEEGKDLYYFDKATQKFSVVDLSAKGMYSKKTIKEIYEKAGGSSVAERASPPRSFKSDWLIPILIIMLCATVIALVLVYEKKGNVVQQAAKEPEVNPQLISYIQKELQKGFSQEQIKMTLINSGWPKDDVEKGFDYLNRQY